MTSPSPSLSRRAASWILALALVGLGASIAAAVVHYQLLADPLYRSVCDFNATWSCTQVYESAYGAFWGVPVAVGGVVWFAAVTLLALVGWQGAGSSRAGRCAGGPGCRLRLRAERGRPVGGALPGVRVDLRPEDLLSVLLHHLFCGGRTVPGRRRRGGRNHDWTASARVRRCARPRHLATRLDAGGELCRRRHRAGGALPEAGRCRDGCRGCRRARAGAGHHRAEQLRPVVLEPAARAGRRARPTARRCSSSSSTTTSARPAG